MAIEDGFELISNVFTRTTVFGIDWIIPTIVIILTLIIITRDVNKWKTLALPVSAAWYIIGLKTSPVILVGAGLVMIMELISIETLGNLLDTVTEKAGGKEIRLGSKAIKIPTVQLYAKAKKVKHKLAKIGGVAKQTETEKARQKGISKAITRKAGAEAWRLLQEKDTKALNKASQTKEANKRKEQERIQTRSRILQIKENKKRQTQERIQGIKARKEENKWNKKLMEIATPRRKREWIRRKKWNGLEKY